MDLNQHLFLVNLYFQKKQLSERTADFYNIYAWLIALHYWFGMSVYKKIEPKLEDQASEEYMIATESINNLAANISAFTDRYDLDNDVSDFVTIFVVITVNLYLIKIIFFNIKKRISIGRRH